MNLSSNTSDFEEPEQTEVSQRTESTGDRTETLLQHGLTYAAGAQVSAQFNQPVLTRLQSGADLRSWPEQIRTRLWWMVVPCLCTFAVGTWVLQWVSAGIPLPAPGNTVIRPEQSVFPFTSTYYGLEGKAPALPAMPGAALPEPSPSAVRLSPKSDGSRLPKKQNGKPTTASEDSSRRNAGKPMLSDHESSTQ